jgi:protoporphyrinogen oxidase
MSDSMGKDEVIILGGGVAALAASYYSGAPVYEAADAPGGAAGSDSSGGFTFDRGIHILQTRNETVLQLLQECGLTMRAFSRNAYIYAQGKYTPYPFQVNTSGLPLATRFRCVWSFLQRKRYPEPNNYEEWIYRSVGKEFAERFLIPYSEKFWTVHPSTMTCEWTGARVPQPSLTQVIRGAFWSRQTRIGTNSDFRYPRGAGVGYGAVASALAARCGPIRVQHRAVSVDVHARRVTFANGKSASYEVMLSTIPLPTLIRICNSVPAPVRQAASQLWANSIYVVNLGIDRANISDRHWVHFPESDVPFFRISYPHTFGENVVPPGMSSVSAEIAYSIHQPLDKSTAINETIAALRRVSAIGKSDKIVMTATHDIPFAYCVYDHARKASLQTVRDWLRSVGIETAGRYGQWTYFWSDEAILSGKKAAERVLKRDDARLRA